MCPQTTVVVKIRDAYLAKRDIASELLQRLSHNPPPRFKLCGSKLQVLRSESFIATVRYSHTWSCPGISPNVELPAEAPNSAGLSLGKDVDASPSGGGWLRWVFVKDIFG